MKFRLLIAFVAIHFVPIGLHAQGDISLEFLSKQTIPNDKEVDRSNIGGLSGIANNFGDSIYYVVADKPPSRIYAVTIDTNDGVKIDFQSVININPELLSNSELEGIAINEELDVIYVSDEQSSGTRIFEVDGSGKFNKIITPLNIPFLPLSGHNSGIEGLTLSEDGKVLYYAFERPVEDCLKDAHVLISSVELSNRNSRAYYHYKIHEIDGDKLGTNGISEILYLNDSSLLVMERAYIQGTGNVVRLYQTELVNQERSSSESCSEVAVFKTRSHLVFDFANVKDFEIDNAEGMTFNADKSRLIIVTDNNFSKKQETQFIILEVTN